MRDDASDVGGGAVPVEAAPDDEDVVDEEEDGGGEDAEHGEHQDREARDGLVVRVRRCIRVGVRQYLWRRRWERQCRNLEDVGSAGSLGIH